MRFLIIDDSSADRELAINHLRREFPGAEFCEVGKETEFHLAINDDNYDIILTDYQLFWSTGIDLLPQLKAHFPNLPIIMFTGTGSEEVAVEGLRAGLSNYVLKKHLDRLPHAIRESLEKRHLHQQYEDAIQQLRISEERYRELFEQGLTGVFVFAPQGRLLACNPAFARLFGFSSAENALNTDISSLYPSSQDHARFIHLLQREKRLEYHEMEMRRRDGEPIYVVANVVGTFNEQSELVEIKGYLFDNTEQHKLARQLQQAQKLESIALLVSGIAHDFNNMLGGIIGHANRGLSRIPATHPLYENLSHIQEIAMRAANTTRQLTAFSRRQVLEPTNVNLNDIVESILAFLEKVLGEHIEIEFQRAENLKIVHVDYTQMEQVLMNLCINARDAMARGGKLIISTQNIALHEAKFLNYNQATADSYVILSVKDTGEGMPPDVMEHIFEPFFTTKELGKGTGLGLSMVHGIVGQHNGFIEVESRPGEGTTFYLYLPTVDSTSLNTSRPALLPLQEQMEQIVPGNGEQLLVVEDDPDLRILMEEALTDYGYHVVTASNGLEGLEIFEKLGNQISLIVADLLTPKMTGKELYDRVHRLNGSVRFLFVSGYQANQISQNFVLEKGFNLLPKPFNLDTLASRVQELLA